MKYVKNKRITGLWVKYDFEHVFLSLLLLKSHFENDNKETKTRQKGIRPQGKKKGLCKQSQLLFRNWKSYCQVVTEVAVPRKLGNKPRREG